MFDKSNTITQISESYLNFMQISMSNFSNEPTISELFELFSEYGHVESFKIVSDSETGKPKVLGVSH